LSARDVAEWLAYDSLDPFGNQRGDLQAAGIASVIANVHRDKKAKAFTRADFIPDYAGDATRTEPTDLAAKINATLGGLAAKTRKRK
jgi:hypothetical protein